MAQANAISPGAASTHSIDPPVDKIEEIRPADEKENHWLVRTLSVIGFIGFWELGARWMDDPLMLCTPSEIVVAFWQMIRNGELPHSLYESAVTLIFGFLLATVVGVALGLFIGRYRKVEAAVDWLVNGLYATPLVALIPLVTLWFGLGFSAKLFIVGIISVFPILINTSSGVRNVAAPLLDVGNAFAASERQTFLKIILPASVPYIMTGIRLGIGRAIIGMVVAEFYTSVGGLGSLIMKYGGQYDTAAMFVPILTLSLLGVLLTTLVRKAEAAFEPWKA